MYKFRRDQVLDPEFLTKLVERFKKEYVPRFIRDQQYYEVKTEILKRTMTDGKPNNRLAHGFCRYITNMATSYFAGQPLGYIRILTQQRIVNVVIFPDMNRRLQKLIQR